MATAAEIEAQGDDANKDDKVDPTDDLLKALDSSEADDETDDKSDEGDDKSADDKTDDKQAADASQKDKDADSTGDKFVDTSSNTAELRQIIRAQSRQMAVQGEKLARLEKKLSGGVKKDDSSTDGGLFEDDNKDSKDSEVPLSRIEQIEEDLKTVSVERGTALDGLLETMAVNPAYQDVKQVCSQSNFQDMFEAIGAAIADRDGTDPLMAAMESELAVWKMANPYQYMYDLIKKYHVNYAEKTDSKKGADVDKKTSADAPDTIVNKGGGSADSKAGWTSKRIDEMDEDDLDTVPKDVYNKYLVGTLD